MFHRLAALFLVSIVGIGLAAPPAPREPATYNALLRYEIFAYRSERVKQYFEMMKALKEAGFVRDPNEIVADDEPDNPKATRMQGRIASKNVDNLLKTRFLRSVLLYPTGTTIPDKGKPVRVDLFLSSGYSPETQRRLARQTARVLTSDAGFVEAVGYDRRNDTRLVGSVPSERLEALIEDVRKLPSAASVGRPLVNISPIRWTIVRPDWPVPTGDVPTPAVPPQEIKFTPDLRTLLKSADASKPTRMEVILGWTPERDEGSWQNLIEDSGAIVEGRIGPLLTVVGIPKQVAPKLAEMIEVAHVRLPRSGSHVVSGPSDGSPKWEPLRASGLVKLHAMGRRGQGSRVAIISDDFAGWQAIDAAKGQLSLFDFTAERNKDLLPDPFPTKGGEGYGTRCARALLRAAPEAELMLVRIDAKAPHQLQTIARAINGETIRTISLVRRVRELREDQVRIEREGREIAEERRRILADPVADDEGLQKQAEYRKKRDAFEQKEQAYEARRSRFFDLYRDLQKLKGIRLVASTLTWTDGFPVDGSSALSRYFDDRPFAAALWFQAAGDSGGQAWSGVFRDEDHNGIMEFVEREKLLPSGSWSPELNFLGWVPAKGGADRVLPANTKLRLTLQWREAHDPLPLRLGDDVYRQPLARFSLHVVRQPDPDGKARPADDLEVVATTAGPPTRLNQTMNSATYEHVIDLNVTQPGRYAVFVKGEPPQGIKAPGEATLPINRKISEVHPRLFVQTLTKGGRAVWGDFSTRQAALGMPADAHRVYAVAAADEEGKARFASADGSPAGMALLSKPDVLAFDDNGGTGEAASFAAGFAASSWPVGGTLYGVLDRMRVSPGTLLRVPEAYQRGR